jgi:hypothetical protein
MSLKNDVNKTTNMINSVVPGFVSTQNVAIDLEDNEFCECKSMFMVQEMAPRLWWCQKHGRSGFSNILDVIKETVENQNKKAGYFQYSFDKLWDIAKGLLETLYIKEKIYFCEDHFEEDLRKHFRKLF